MNVASWVEVLAADSDGFGWPDGIALAVAITSAISSGAQTRGRAGQDRYLSTPFRWAIEWADEETTIGA